MTSGNGKIDPRTPVIVGAGQALQRPGEGSQLEPVELAVEALRRAGEDSGTGDALLRRADTVGHVATTGWLYRDEAAITAAAVGAEPRRTVRTSALGGDGAGRLLGDCARAVAEREADVVLLAGGEALATMASHQRAGTQPDWGLQPDCQPDRVVGKDRPPVNDAEVAVGLIAPVNVYALIETAIRSDLGTSREEHQARIAGLWARFSEVAAKNPAAWLNRAYSAVEIAEPTTANRLVSEPYTKLLTANIQVDQAAALILTSAEAAEAAGVPRDRWVFPLASAFAADEWFFSERVELTASPAIHACAQAVLEHGGASIDDVAYLDLYSCFPSAIQIAAGELGLPIDDSARPLTATGGLTFGGGPGNNYSMHGLAAITDRLRKDPDALGISSALGWYMTKHSYTLLSGRPPAAQFREINAGPAIEASAPRRSTNEFTGTAVLEAYTLPYGRDGEPENVVVSALAGDGTRVLSRSHDPASIAAIRDGDPLGEEITLPLGLGSASR